MLQYARWAAIVANPLPPVIVALVIAVAPGSLGAQENDDKGATVTLNEEQRRLNNKATKALAEDPPDTSGAIRLIEAALEVGKEGNVLYMTLGRAHQKAGNCTSAERAYEQSRGSAPVEGVPTEAVHSRLDRYTEELDDCFGTLRIACQSADDTKLRVSGRDIPCDEPARLEPGKHVVTARRGAARVDIPVDVVGGEEARVHVDLTTDDVAGDATSATGAEAAKNVVSVALTEATDEVDDEVEQREREHRNASLVAAQITSERVALSAETISTRVQNATAEGTDASARVSGDDTSAEASKKMVVGSSNYGELSGVQLALLAPFGGFAVQGSDGLADGGVLYGVSFDGVIGWGFAKNLGADAHVMFDFTTGDGLALKSLEGEENQELGQRHWRFMTEFRAWLLFLGVGVFVDHRSQTLRYGEGDVTTPVWTGGPSLILSTGGLSRAEGYFDVIARWAPLFGGDETVFSAGFEAASGYLMIGMFYERFTGQNVANSTFRTGETLMLKFGIRLPIQLATAEEEEG